MSNMHNAFKRMTVLGYESSKQSFVISFENTLAQVLSPLIDWITLLALKIIKKFPLQVDISLWQEMYINYIGIICIKLYA